MKLPELVLKVKEKMEELEAAEQKGVAAGVWKVLDDLNDLLIEELAAADPG